MTDEQAAKDVVESLDDEEGYSATEYVIAGIRWERERAAKVCSWSMPLDTICPVHGKTVGECPLPQGPTS